MAKQYDLLLLDADGTIFDFSAAEDKALAGACAAMDIPLDAQRLADYKRINADLWRAYERREVTQDALRVLRFERFLASLPPGAPQDAQAMAEHFVQSLGAQTDEIEGAYAFLQAAAARAPVIVVTNGIGEVQRARFARSRLGRCVSHLVISGDVGIAKPDPRIIRHALALGGAGADRALMVGDSLTSDIAAAHAAGVDSCWYNPEGAPNGTDWRPTWEVCALDEVLQWL